MGPPLLGTRPQCPGPAPASDPGVQGPSPHWSRCPRQAVPDTETPIPTLRAWGRVKEGPAKPRLRCAHGFRGRQLQRLFRPRLHILSGLAAQTTPTEPEGPDVRRRPHPAHPLAFGASGPPNEVEARGPAEGLLAPIREAGGMLPALIAAFDPALVALCREHGC